MVAMVAIVRTLKEIFGVHDVVSHAQENIEVVGNIAFIATIATTLGGLV